MTIRSKEVSVIRQEFFKAGARYSHEFDFQLFRGSRYLAAFYDVLFSGPRCLYHLIDRAVVLLQETTTETYRGVKDNLRLFVR